MGHGHVTPNADGSKNDCGGLGVCRVCVDKSERLGHGHLERMSKAIWLEIAKLHNLPLSVDILTNWLRELRGRFDNQDVRLVEAEREAHGSQLSIKSTNTILDNHTACIEDINKGLGDINDRQDRQARNVAEVWNYIHTVVEKTFGDPDAQLHDRIRMVADDVGAMRQAVGDLQRAMSPLRFVPEQTMPGGITWVDEGSTREEMLKNIDELKISIRFYILELERFKRQNDDLQVANNRLLERARKAEAALVDKGA